MQTLRNARSIAADDDDGKVLPQRFTTATGLARGSATLIARQVLVNDECSEPTWIRKTRVLLVDRTVNKVSMVSASCFETVGFHCTCSTVAHDRCVPFGDKVVFARDFFRFPPVPNAEDD